MERAGSVMERAENLPGDEGLRLFYLSPIMAQIPFVLLGEYVELNQLLKLVGACNSGGEGKMLVAQGLVRVDGQVELRKTCKIRVGQVVTMDGLNVRVEAGRASDGPV